LSIQEVYKLPSIIYNYYSFGELDHLISEGEKSGTAGKDEGKDDGHSINTLTPELNTPRNAV
jgi:hypothetical protein